MSDWIKFNCIEIEQPIGTFYIGSINWLDLIKVSYADIRRIEDTEQKREVESYLGIQRELSKNRVKEISQYVTNVDASFPTSVLLAIKSYETDEYGQKNKKNIVYDGTNSSMWIRNDESIAKILDGQHRIEGLRKAYEDGKLKNENFFLNLTIFVDMDIEDQAMIFATINKTQTKVNKSLVYDLYAYGKTRSPQKSAHNIVKLLNQENDSPFKGKIKILGKADEPFETITQSTFVENLLRYISSNPMQDRDDLKRNKNLNRAEGNSLKRLPFRNLFIDEEDEKIAKIVWNYFTAVGKKWPKAWYEVKPEMVLNKSTGFIALMRFLKDAYLYLCKDENNGDIDLYKIGSTFEIDQFYNIFYEVNIGDEEFNREKYVPGSGGQSHLYNDLLEKSKIGKQE